MKGFITRTVMIYDQILFWKRYGLRLKTEDGRFISVKPLKSSYDTEFRGMIVFCSAEIDLKFPPKITPDSTIVFPKTESMLLRQAFEYYKNLISVAEVCRVELSVPTPGMGFIPENETDKAHLDKSSGFDDRMIAKFAFGGNYVEPLLRDQLLDRTEGLAFMAAANALHDNVAKLHESFGFRFCCIISQ